MGGNEALDGRDGSGQPLGERRLILGARPSSMPVDQLQLHRKKRSSPVFAKRDLPAGGSNPNDPFHCARCVSRLIRASAKALLRVDAYSHFGEDRQSLREAG